jgi:hypothetical protein
MELVSNSIASSTLMTTPPHLVVLRTVERSRTMQVSVVARVRASARHAAQPASAALSGKSHKGAENVWIGGPELQSNHQ